MTTHEHFQQQASELVLQDLIDCLFAEQFFEGAEQELLSPAQLRAFCAPHAGLSEQLQFPTLPANGLIWQWSISQNPLFCVLVPVVRGIVQPIQRISNTPVYAVTWASGQSGQNEQGAFQLQRLDAVSFMELVTANLADGLLGKNKEGAALFLEWVRDAVQQTAWSMDHRVDMENLLSKSPADFFQTLEQYSSLRDRPFHPVAKVKRGFSQEDYQQYMAEFGQEVPLHWLAINKHSLECGIGVTDPQQNQPAQFLLTTAQQAILQQEMAQRGIAHSHVALPVHPWQLRHVLPKQLAAELQSGDCVLLRYQQGGFLPTSSVRSLAPASGSPHYLKLPLGIYSLGASRYLPAIKMINGQRSEKLLKQALALDSSLAQRVFLCNETKWWAYMPENGNLFDEAPRHLSAMVRSYPESVMQDPSYRLIPMAALGTLLPGHDQHFFDAWLQYRQLVPDAASVLMLFKELCQTFIDINLRMFRLGMLAEVHGQNAVLVWRDGQAAGLLLRDHDSLRLYVPWLNSHGLADPEYRLRPGHANTLYHETPDELLFYLQTLGIQVNLRAVIEVLAARYDIAQPALWSVLRQVMEQLIEQVEFSAEARTLLQQRLFHERSWPLKLLVKPMIERAGGPGSMPFGKSQTQNPFHYLGQPTGKTRERDEQQEGVCAVPV
ncbi:MAG TPA: IucA/IucC family protein [Noviherbaspirillum sp.]|nr:IucA/IucC family protein [Noviherbaspirillum sp.]